MLGASSVAGSPSPSWRTERVWRRACAAAWCGLVLAVEVVRRLLPVGATAPAHDLPSGLGTQQVDVASAGVVAAVEPVFDPFGHPTTLEHMFDCSGLCGRCRPRFLCGFCGGVGRGPEFRYFGWGSV